MITREQALTAQRFHVGECSKVTGPRGGVKISIVECRRNGQTKTWVRTPENFSVPVKRAEVPRRNRLPLCVVDRVLLATLASS